MTGTTTHCDELFLTVTALLQRVPATEGTLFSPSMLLRVSSFSEQCCFSWIQGHPEYGFGFKALVCHDGVRFIHVVLCLQNDAYLSLHRPLTPDIQVMLPMSYSLCVFLVPINVYCTNRIAR